ncbi:hypothetical protein pEaSNUABM56_00085 [Erwinia phage pEa_SNUABM_56]|uniref:Lipoprotein n=1 Tax=Erwinia phage pEp_SNUABM_01 TaxID=2601643 RepID=A0A5J6DAI7_9CAUD|nr:hypothetical protein HWC63_gp058 [Erwinia phage pEp_SNUABM_01]QEQ94884.1 hypothetical protein pEpSNUABM01_058 [Erwinia phage pEp_SNUABM_01]UYL84815.1 hypothetical protein pEaSNUABM55_00017 [Erwinia phage pEa_SNUABM_55]UYL85130.1 hypothetical protein pEaSNUABM56_00085 [Erwinia phage pEa_SNUABM_56]
MKKMVTYLFMALGILVSCLFLAALIATGVAFSGGYTFGTPEFGHYMENAVLGGLFLGFVACAITGVVTMES